LHFSVVGFGFFFCGPFCPSFCRRGRTEKQFGPLPICSRRPPLSPSSTPCRPRFKLTINRYFSAATTVLWITFPLSLSPSYCEQLLPPHLRGRQPQPKLKSFPRFHNSPRPSDLFFHRPRLFLPSCLLSPFQETTRPLSILSFRT